MLQFQQIKITGMFIHMNVGKYGLATLIRIASSTFGVFQENDLSRFYRIPNSWIHNGITIQKTGLGESMRMQLWG